jgi:glycerophosphoryl diester phosphodiesterase
MHCFLHLRDVSSILTLWLVIPLFALAAPATKSPAEALLASPRPLVIAHRGFSAVAPENTLPAFRHGVAAGADMVELDYHHSKDGALVVLHDYTLDRTTDATNRWSGNKLAVLDHTLAQLRELEAGLWFRPSMKGVELPTLIEALDVIQNGGVTLIERKAGDAAACVKLLKERNLINEVVVQAFDWNYLRDFRRLESRQVLGALGPPSSRGGRKLAESEKPLNVAWLDEIKSLGAQAAVWNKMVDATTVKAAHERGLKVWVYTINDVATAHQMLAMGVDGIITDNPAVIWKALTTMTPARAVAR